MPFSAYVICATPRSGSTLLCDLLATSGVAGRPQSFFRTEDIDEWAASWGVGGSSTADNPEFNRAYLSAMARAGRAGAGLFGLRLMHRSRDEATRRLRAAFALDDTLPNLFAEAFGPTLYVHLSRTDKAAQAASLVRAQQTGLWHLAQDGSERERTAPARLAVFDAGMLKATRDELVADDQAWNDFFKEHAIAPVCLTYERLSAEPLTVLARVFTALGLDPAHAATASVMTRKMADSTSADWARRMLNLADLSVD